MRYLFNLICAFVVFAVGISDARADDYVGTFRHLSVVIRDQLPSVAEARDFNNATDKPSKLNDYVAIWLTSPEHKLRVQRHFDDMFGISPGVFIADPLLDLIQHNASAPDEAPPDIVAGVYHLPVSVKPTCGTPVSASAWWSDTPVSVCSSAVSADIQFSTGTIRCSDAYGANGLRHASCGCGPNQIICYPRHLKSNIVVGVAREFSERGYYAYSQGLSWLDLFGGGNFYGDRWLYHHYLWQEKVAAMLELPTAAESTFLAALPLNSKLWSAFPDSPVVRSGVATSPAFLRRFNNFRSRIRAITEQLLCKDIDGSLNVDGYAQFLNPNFSAFDLSHGSQASCASCHYSLDNFGSTLFGWTPEGFYEKWAPKSQVGHVFGQDGTGPRFLMASYVSRGTGFTQCMAQKTWENFSGAKWSDLPSSDQASILSAAAEGPRQTIREVLTGDAIKNIRLNKATTTSSVVPVSYDFAVDINPLLERTCAGSTCHSAGNPRGNSSTYVGNQVEFKKAPAIRISNGSMPPPLSAYKLTTEERNRLILYLGQ